VYTQALTIYTFTCSYSLILKPFVTVWIQEVCVNYYFHLEVKGFTLKVHCIHVYFEYRVELFFFFFFGGGVALGCGGVMNIRVMFKRLRSVKLRYWIYLHVYQLLLLHKHFWNLVTFEWLSKWVSGMDSTFANVEQVFALKDN
jgi:hypothetical protein